MRITIHDMPNVSPAVIELLTSVSTVNIISITALVDTSALPPETPPYNTPAFYTPDAGDPTGYTVTFTIEDTDVRSLVNWFNNLVWDPLQTQGAWQFADNLDSTIE